MSEYLPKATVELFRHLDVLLPEHEYAIHLRFRGQHNERMLATLEVPAGAFGKDGGAELSSRGRTTKAMQESDAVFGCACPFDLKENTSKSTTYILDAVNVGTSLEKAVGTFVRYAHPYTTLGATIIKMIASGNLQCADMRVNGGLQTGISIRLQRRRPQGRLTRKSGLGHW